MRSSIALLMVVVLCAFVGLAFADETECAPKIQPGDVGIYFDPDGTQFSRVVIPLTPFYAYVLAFDLPGGFLGYELAVNGIAPLFLLEVQYLGTLNQGNVPGYLQCDGGLRPFTPAVNCESLFPAGCSILNPTLDLRACPLEEASFGTLKAAF